MFTVLRRISQRKLPLECKAIDNLNYFDEATKVLPKFAILKNYFLQQKRISLSNHLCG